MGSGPIKGRADFLDVGDWNAACSMCGRKRKASTLVQNWQGQWRCPEHNEPRQPQDFVRGVADVQTPAFVQRELDIDVQVCTFNGISSIPGLAIPGCEIPGNAAFDRSYYPPTMPPPSPFLYAWLTELGEGWTTGTGKYWETQTNTDS
jgi:hypothetical protein